MPIATSTPELLYHGQTPPAAGTINWYDEPNNTEWNASDIAIEGYTYIEQGGAQADYYPANVNNWKTVSHGRLERVTLQPTARSSMRARWC